MKCEEDRGGEGEKKRGEKETEGRKWWRREGKNSRMKKKEHGARQRGG